MNPFASLINPPAPPQHWPDERRLVRILETEDDQQPFGEPEAKQLPSPPVYKQRRAPDPRRLPKWRTPERAARLERIKEIIALRRQMTAQALAQALGVNERVIWKDMLQLQAEGFPVRGVTCRGYVYQSEGEQ